MQTILPEGKWQENGQLECRNGFRITPYGKLTGERAQRKFASASF